MAGDEQVHALLTLQRIQHLAAQGKVTVQETGMDQHVAALTGGDERGLHLADIPVQHDCGRYRIVERIALGSAKGHHHGIALFRDRG